MVEPHNSNICASQSGWVYLLKFRSKSQCKPWNSQLKTKQNLRSFATGSKFIGLHKCYNKRSKVLTNYPRYAMKRGYSLGPAQRMYIIYITTDFHEWRVNLRSLSKIMLIIDDHFPTVTGFKHSPGGMIFHMCHWEFLRYPPLLKGSASA